VSVGLISNGCSLPCLYLDDAADAVLIAALAGRAVPPQKFAPELFQATNGSDRKK